MGNGGCGYVLKNPELMGGARKIHRRGSKLRLRVCCGHRLPLPETATAEEPGFSTTTFGSAVSSPLVSVTLEPGSQTSYTKPVIHDGYHPIFNHEVVFAVPDSPICILLFEVRESPSKRPTARNAVSLDAVQEGFRWLTLRSALGSTIPHGGLLIYVEFVSH